MPARVGSAQARPAAIATADVAAAEAIACVKAASPQTAAASRPTSAIVRQTSRGCRAVPREPAAQAMEVFAEVLSGAYDANTAEAEAAEGELAAPAKRVLAAESDAPKLHKVLAQAGVGSRRDLEQMVVEGRVTVNGEVAHTGQRVSFGDRIQVDGKPVRYRIAPPPPRVLAYHKPVGEVVTHDDPQQRPTVFAAYRAWRRASGSPSAAWTSIPRACCCSPTAANWPISSDASAVRRGA